VRKRTRIVYVWDKPGAAVPQPKQLFRCCKHCRDAPEHHGGHDEPCRERCNDDELERLGHG
jgi:hypothetical protein